MSRENAGPDGMETTADLAVVLTTVESPEEARSLARKLLDLRLAACVQISAVESLYLWEGEVAAEPEMRMVIKSPKTKLSQLTAFLVADHSYDTPQIIVLEGAAVNRGYLQWALDVTAGDSQR